MTAEQARPDVAARLLDAFSASSIALVGATERSSWTKMMVGSVEPFGFTGRLHLVNRTGTPVFGRPAVTSLAEIGEPVDIVLLAVPRDAVADAMREAAAVGIRTAVVLAVGFGEEGEAGKAREEALVDLAHELDMVFLGPNCIGFTSIVDGVPAWFGPPPQRMTTGGVAIVSQSGATSVTIADLAGRQQIGISHLVTTGNEACVDLADVVAALVAHDEVRVVCAFVESIRRPQAFLEVAQAALRAGKPLVVLKAGVSDFSAAAAVSHTGALVGDDDVVDAAFRASGVVRVRTFEEMIATAGLLASAGLLPPGGFAMMTNSGGIAEVAADLAAARGLDMPPPARRGDLLGGKVRLDNPLDLTGLVYTEDAILEAAMTAFRDDPGIGFVAYVQTLLPVPERILGGAEFLQRTALGLRDMGKPALLASGTVEEVADSTVALAREVGLPAFTGVGMRDLVDAVHHAMWWSDRVRAAAAPTEVGTDPVPLAVPSAEHRHGTWSEHQTLELLGAAGVPVVPWSLAADADGAVKAAESFGFPVVVKVASEQIAHKTDIGGVVVGVQDGVGARSAFDAVTAAGAAVPGATVDGAVVAAMRTDGFDLIVGVVRDPQWGLTLAVGWGGTLVEVLDEKVVRLLPVTHADVREMLHELRGNEILDGVRGARAVDRERVVAAIARVAALAYALGDDLEALEVNPLRVSADHVDVLDALCIWKTR